jgi:hypothetical protein
VRSGAARETAVSLLRGELEDGQALADAPEILAVVLEKDDLPDGKDNVTEPADERRGHVVYGELLRDLEAPLIEADLERERLQVGRRGWMGRWRERRHCYCIATGR